MEKNLELKIEESWKNALLIWNSPSVPSVVAVLTQEQISELGEIGKALSGELAFMKYPEFQTYINLENIIDLFKEDPKRGVAAVTKHELGHRYCPYDTVTSIILRHAIKKELEGKEVPYSKDAASSLILNLFADMCINTNLARKNEEDIAWAYQQLSKGKKDSKLWRVYAKSMEFAWDKKLLPEDAVLKEDESQAARQIADLFNADFFDKSKWKDNVSAYTKIINKFLEDESKDKESALDSSSGNIPEELDDKTEQELAKRLAEIGSDGLPKNPSGLKEFKEIMAGFGKGDSKKASIAFYDKLSDSYNVMFATSPFGRSRINPFQPVKWTPAMGIEKLDVDYSVQSGGRIIPGVNTHTWNTRKRESQGGIEEVVQDLDLYLDSSQSMPDPTSQISLPVLAGFVVAKKAHKKGVKIRATNFSGQNQNTTQDWTRDLYKIFENLVTYFNGGTVFPVNKLLEGVHPKQVLVITDTFLANEEKTADSIRELKKKKGNNVAIYSLHKVDRADYLINAGAEVVHGTTTDIFKRVIGKANEVYSK